MKGPPWCRKKAPSRGIRLPTHARNCTSLTCHSIFQANEREYNNRERRMHREFYCKAVKDLNHSTCQITFDQCLIFSKIKMVLVWNPGSQIFEREGKDTLKFFLPFHIVETKYLLRTSGIGDVPWISRWTIKFTDIWFFPSNENVFGIALEILLNVIWICLLFTYIAPNALCTTKWSMRSSNFTVTNPFQKIGLTLTKDWASLSICKVEFRYSCRKKDVFWNHLYTRFKKLRKHKNKVLGESVALSSICWIGQEGKQ